MSGGVDSAVAALLCCPLTASTVAVTLELWSDPENDAERSCCSASAVAQARALAHSIGLPHFTLDLRDEFRAGVVEPFIAGYAAGETPNPCVGCNGHVRLDAMLDARRPPRLRDARHRPLRPHRRARPRDGLLLRVAADPAKDQTYMLAALSPESLARMRFPLGELTKPEVRRLAAQAGCRSRAKADSQDLCFLAGTDRATVPRAPRRARPTGPARSSTRPARVLGATGSRAASRSASGAASASLAGEPLYVLDKDAGQPDVTVGPRASARDRARRVRAARLHRARRARRPRQASLPLAAACARRAASATCQPVAIAR